MTETSGQEQSRWVTTVIMSTALQNHEISTILQRQQHRVRYSDSVEPGSVIFSLSGVAFVLSDTQDLLTTGEEEFSQRIQKFMSIHRNSFLVLSAALHGPEEWNVMLRIQKSTYPADNTYQIVLHTRHQNYLLAITKLMLTRHEYIKMQINKIQTIIINPLLLEAKLLTEMDFHGSRFLGSNLRIIPVHNSAETVKLMLTIAKVTSKPQANDIRYKMATTKAQIVENSPVWKMLQEYQLQCN